MSIQAIAAVIDCDVGEAAAKMLLVSIANAHNQTTGLCCPSIDRLAAESSMGRSTVKRWLKWLRDHGYIEIEERRDVSGRQQAHDFRLTLSKGSSLDPSPDDEPQDVVEPKLDQREVTGEPDEGSTAEPPLKEPEEKPISPQPPASGGQSFAWIWEGYPQEHRGNRENAEAAYRRLSAESAARLAGALPLAVRALSRRKGRFPALVSFIRSEAFEDFVDAPDVDPDGCFIVKPGTAEWNEWLGWIRRKYGDKAVQRQVAIGFFLPERRWPEDYAPASKSQVRA